MYDPNMQPLKRRLRILEIKTEIIQKEVDFVEMQVCKTCRWCKGTGQYLYRKYMEAYLKGTMECFFCQGHGVVCSHCNNGEDVCDCGTEVDKNWKDYSYSSKYWVTKYCHERGHRE